MTVLHTTGRRARPWRTLALAGLVAALALGLVPVPAAPASAEAAPADLYAVEFVSTAATGADMNDAGDMVGTSYTDPGCGPYCLPPIETVVWRGGQRFVLPEVPGLSGIGVRSINNQGWVAGYAGFPGATTHAVVWKPQGDGYVAIDLGTLPGTTISDAAGIDNQGRVVGWSSTLSFPPTSAPFVWTEQTGLQDLSALGFPADMPLAISSNGAVATPSYWYQLGDPASVVAMPAPPPGFYPPGSYATAINDLGDQARFLVSTSGQNLVYLFRFHRTGSWQQISFSGNGHSSPYGIGSINTEGDITATVLGNGVIAPGPDGMTQSLDPLVSSAYPGADVTIGGPMNAAGQILAQVMIGRSQRLVRLVPAEACGANCIRVSRMQVVGRFYDDPNDPGECTVNAKNRVQVKLQVVTETGAKLAGATVTGRFLDDYWLNQPVTGTSNSQGVATLRHEGLGCVGAVAFLVDNVAKDTRTLDRTTGVLTGYVIPQ